MPTTVAQRPNKYWPIVVGVGLIGLFGYLIFTNQKHSTQSGDNIHKFANGGSYADGSKRINYNRNNDLSYGYKGLFSGSNNASLLNLSLLGMFLTAMCAGIYGEYMRRKEQSGCIVCPPDCKICG
ncbi:beta d protein [Ligustrum mosaic virus]|nr:beta d protein [Ligustrum mosaic virus]